MHDLLKEENKKMIETKNRERKKNSMRERESEGEDALSLSLFFSNPRVYLDDYALIEVIRITRVKGGKG